MKSLFHYYQKERGVALHFLLSGKFMHRSTHADAAIWTTAKAWIVDHNKRVDDDETIAATDKMYYKFIGMHLDNEPYFDEEWPKVGEEADVGVFKQFYLDAQEWCHQHGLILGSDISDGFEYIDTDVEGENLMQWHIENLDFVTVMSYRYKTELAIEASRDEIWAADRTNCTGATTDASNNYPTNVLTKFGYQNKYRRANGCAGVMWSLETDDVTWGEWFISRGIVISFFGKNRSELNNAIGTISEYYKDHDYAGFAVHFLPTFHAMGGSRPCADDECTAAYTGGGDDGGNPAVKQSMLIVIPTIVISIIVMLLF
eukprot:UN01476